MLDRDAILGMDDASRGTVRVPEWDGETVHIRSMTSLDSEEFQKRMNDSDPYLGAFVLARCVCNEDGSRMFKDADIKRLGQLNSKAVQRIALEAVRISAATKDEIEALEKNLETTQSDS